MDWFTPVKLDTESMKKVYRNRPEDIRISEAYWFDVIENHQPEIYEPIVALFKSGRKDEIYEFLDAFHELFENLCLAYGYDAHTNTIDGRDIEHLPKLPWE